MYRRTLVVPFAIAALLGSCATLGQLIQPPEFSNATSQNSELRLLAPSSSRPLGGASIRLYAHVRNPNAFGLTLARLAGNLQLEGEQAADVDLPLGLPLKAQGDTVFPIDLNISFANLPQLASALRDAVTRNTTVS